VSVAVRFVDEVVGIDRNTVTADEAGLVLVKVPLGPRGFEHGVGVDVPVREEPGEFVH
jgi:hypothetical protein